MSHNSLERTRFLQLQKSRELSEVFKAAADKVQDALDNGDAAQQVTTLSALLAARDQLAKHQSKGQREPAATRTDFKPFLEWFKKHGGRFAEGVELHDSLREGNGVVAKSKVAAGTTLMTVPTALAMHIYRYAEDPRTSFARPGSNKALASPDFLLALGLLAEKHDPQSFWRPYLSVLPARHGLPSLPLLWELPEWEALQGSLRYRSAVGSLVAAVRAYQAILEELVQSGERRGWLPSSWHWDEWAWALTVVQSRQNLVQIEVPSHDHEHGPDGACHGAPTVRLVNAQALLPGFDLFNHSPDAAVAAEASQQPNVGVSVTAKRDIAANSQVLMHYANRSNSDLLLTMGFTVPLAEQAKLRSAEQVSLMQLLPKLEKTTRADDRRRALAASGYNGPSLTVLRWAQMPRSSPATAAAVSKQLHPGVVCYLRALLASEKDFAAAAAAAPSSDAAAPAAADATAAATTTTTSSSSSSASSAPTASPPLDVTKPLDAASESLVLATLEKLVAKLVAAYPGTSEADREKLPADADAPLTTLQHILVLRIAERARLAEFHAVAKQALDAKSFAGFVFDPIAFSAATDAADTAPSAASLKKKAKKLAKKKEKKAAATAAAAAGGAPSAAAPPA